MEIGQPQRGASRPWWPEIRASSNIKGEVRMVGPGIDGLDWTAAVPLPDAILGDERQGLMHGRLSESGFPRLAIEMGPTTAESRT